MSSRDMLRFAAVTAALVALAAAAVLVARRPASVAVTPPPSDPRAAALFACEGRAELLFVGRCRQRCQLESRGKPEAERAACVQACGTQPERAAFVKGCVAKAGFP